MIVDATWDEATALAVRLDQVLYRIILVTAFPFRLCVIDGRLCLTHSEAFVIH